jgi:hypothetical protein
MDAIPLIPPSHIGKKAPVATMAIADLSLAPNAAIPIGTQAIGGIGLNSSIGPEKTSESEGTTNAIPSRLNEIIAAKPIPANTRNALARTSLHSRPSAAKLPRA